MFAKIYFFFLLFNVALTIVDGYNEELGNTEVAGNITSVAIGTGIGDMPRFFNSTNPTGTLLGNFTDTTNSSTAGHVGTGSFFDPITQPIERLYMVGELAFQVITGNFIINVMNAFTTSIGVGFPDDWNFGFQIIIGLINIFLIVYIVTSRSFTSFT